MKERGILMNGDMVRATLREVDPKWQTRRIMKRNSPFQNHNGKWEWYPGGEDAGFHAYNGALTQFNVPSGWAASWCPFGAPGDRLWVREAFALIVPDDKDPCERWVAYRSSDTQVLVDCASDTSALKPIRTREAKHKGRWTPGIYMPRWASRITLEITNVRVERLQDISEEDAKSEGVTLSGTKYDQPWVSNEEEYQRVARFAFLEIWESINGENSWTANPWVWVIEFKRIKP